MCYRHSHRNSSNSFYAASTELRVRSASAYSSSTDSTTVATQLWNFTTDGSIYTSSIVADGCIYALSSFEYEGSVGNVYCLNASTGTQIWNYTIEYPVGYILAGSNMIYAVSAGGFGKNVGHALSITIYALETKNVTSPTLAIVVITGSVIVVLTVVFLAYRIRRIGLKRPPHS